MRILPVAIFMALFLVACQTKNTEKNSLNGIWKSIGSGWVLEIQDSTQCAFYDVTGISCLPRRQASLAEIQNSLSLANDTLSLIKGVMTYKFTRAEELPELCISPIPETQKIDPLYNFDVFSATVKEHYAFMELNDIAWESLYKRQRGKLSEESTMAELYVVLEETLELLNDNHAYLEATDKVYELLEELETKEEEENTSKEELPEYGDFQVANAVVKHHMETEMTKDSWLINWGIMENNIGYIMVKAMWLYADLDIPQELIDEKGFVDAYVDTFHKMDEGTYINKEVAGIRTILDSAMKDLKDTQSIVIDVRFNGGGQDAVSFEILKQFNPGKKKVVTTQLKLEEGYTSPLSLYLEGNPNAYTNPVYVLTSQQTGSAAEAFSICSKAIPHMQRLGSPTQGALSTALEKTLPNGWVFSISNEVYMDTQGNSYENIGVPVDHQIPYPDDRQTFFRSIIDDLHADKQAILNAIEQLSS